MDSVHVFSGAEFSLSRRSIDPVALKVLYRLIRSGFVAYLVGGAVRDLLLGCRPKDFDVGTTAHPYQIQALFRNSRLIGKRFPIVHVLFGRNRFVEVTTFRSAHTNSDSPPPERQRAAQNLNPLSFGTPEQDAWRRDFTVNALFYDPATFRVIDYVGGLADLKTRTIRTVGEPWQHVREDPIRIVRAVRLAGKLGLNFESRTREAIQDCLSLVLETPRPRLAEEISKLLAIEGADRALQVAWEIGLMQVLFPRLAREMEYRGRYHWALRNLAALNRLRQNGTELSRPMVLAALFADLALWHHEGPSRFTSFAEELRQRGFSRADIENVRLLLNALWRLRKSRHLSRLTRQAYYGSAKLLYQTLAPNYGYDPEPYALLRTSNGSKSQNSSLVSLVDFEADREAKDRFPVARSDDLQAKAWV